MSSLRDLIQEVERKLAEEESRLHDSERDRQMRMRKCQSLAHTLDQLKESRDEWTAPSDGDDELGC